MRQQPSSQPPASTCLRNEKKKTLKNLQYIKLSLHANTYQSDVCALFISLMQENGPSLLTDSMGKLKRMLLA